MNLFFCYRVYDFVSVSVSFPWLYNYRITELKLWNEIEFYFSSNVCNWLWKKSHTAESHSRFHLRQQFTSNGFSFSNRKMLVRAAEKNKLSHPSEISKKKKSYTFDTNVYVCRSVCVSMRVLVWLYVSVCVWPFTLHKCMCPYEFVCVCVVRRCRYLLYTNQCYWIIDKRCDMFLYSVHCYYNFCCCFMLSAKTIQHLCSVCAAAVVCVFIVGIVGIFVMV